MSNSVKFFTNAIRGKNIGAIARSSRFVVRDILEKIENETLKTVVEYGPGDGVVTHEILKRLSPKGKMLVVELDPNFVKTLKRIKDPRLEVVQGTIQEISNKLDSFGFKNPDLILSSIPFSMIEKSDREKIVKNTFLSLKKDGKFIIFHQYSKLMQKYLEKYFDEVLIQFEPKNFLPCFIMAGYKK